MISIPKQLRKKEFRFILLKKQAKIPFEKDWQNTNNYYYTDPTLLEHLKIDCNYGVLCGQGKLFVLDFDDEKVQNEITQLLPKTFTVKTGRGLLHKYFVVDSPENIKGFDENKNTLFDGQGDKKQVVGAGSIHPNGNKYEVFDDSPMAEMKMSELKAILFKYLKKEKSDADYKIDNVTEKIKNKISILDLMKEYNYDTSRNPTTCKLGHSSKGGACFSYDEKQGLWHCFHCEKGGDIFSFVMEHDNCDFVKARQKLMTKTGTENPIENHPFVITNYIANVEKFYEIQPFFYDKKGLFWFWQYQEHKWEMIDETDIMNGIDRNLGLIGQTVPTNTKNNYLEAFKRVGRKKMPTPTPSHWIQFQNTIFDLKTKKTFQATPEYYMCNPIPWKLGNTNETPVINKIFKEWVGIKYTQTLYEIIAYCTITNYPIHLAFCLVGCGRNGKTQFQQLLLKFIGINNCCSTELDTLIDSRFETFKLYKKLVCQLGETNFGIMKKTSMFKKLTGGDFIGFEAKHKSPFNDYNYAKIIINSNSLPTSNDTSEGFYRRWLIIDFPNEFIEGKDIINTIPEYEYECLGRKCIEILPDLLDNGKFTNQGNIEERKQKYILASNPLNTFLSVCCDVGNNDYYIKLSDCFNAYCQFLRQIKARVVSRKEFNTALNDEGFYAVNTTRKVGNVYNNRLDGDVFDKGWWVDGLKLKSDFTTIVTNTTRFSLSFPYVRKEVEKSSVKVVNVVKFSELSRDYQGKCSYCGKDNQHILWKDEEGNHLCSKCHNEENKAIQEKGVEILKIRTEEK